MKHVVFFLNNRIASKLFILLFALLVIHSCSDKVAQKPFIQPPFPALDPQFASFTFDAQKGDSILLPSGTLIVVPPDALVDADGKPVSGQVELKYREFNDAKGILLSGIPMRYDSAGQVINFTTAGMFEMHAYQQDKELALAQSKTIPVRFGSQTVGNDFNFYRLDQNARNWAYLGTDTAEVNIEKRIMKEQIEKQLPEIKVPDETLFALNYDGIIDVYFKDDNNKIYKNRKSKLPANRAKEYGLTYSGVYCYETVKYKGVNYLAAMMVWRRVSDKPFPKWADNSWTKSFKALGKNMYSITITNDKEKVYTAQMEAVMPLKALFAFAPDYWKKNYDDAIAKINEEIERLKVMAEVYRTFEVNQFGIYNYDKMWSNENRVDLAADFKFDAQVNEELSSIEIIYLPGDDRTVIKWPQDVWSRLKIVPSEKARIFAVLPGNKLAIFPSAKFAQINFDSLRTATNPKYLFSLQTEATVVNTEEALKQMLGI